MRRLLALWIALAPAAAGQTTGGSPPAVVDRIVATVEGDVLTLSEVRELGAFQRLLGMAPSSDAALRDHLINQWIVATEAAGSRFPAPTAADVDAEVQKLVATFPSLSAWQDRWHELGLTDASVRRLLERRLLTLRYLDHKFRFLVQIEEPAIAAYYRDTLSPELARRGQPVPPLEDVREGIHEVLLQREVTRMAERWLADSRVRLRITLRNGGAQP
jgi:hypothetical protein